MDGNASGILKKIAGALHIERGGSTDQRFHRIVEHLRGRSFLLMIDQAQNLRFAKGDKPLYILADLFDATGTAQLWAATDDLVAYLNRQRVRACDESLIQVRRRIFPAVDLMSALRGSDGGGQPLVTLDQIREMFARNKMRIAPDSARWLCQIANTPDGGSLGACVQFVCYAGMLAELAGKSVIDVPLLRQAMKMGLGEERATTMIHEIESEAGRLAIVG